MFILDFHCYCLYQKCLIKEIVIKIYLNTVVIAEVTPKQMNIIQIYKNNLN